MSVKSYQQTDFPALNLAKSQISRLSPEDSLTPQARSVSSRTLLDVYMLSTVTPEPMNGALSGIFKRKRYLFSSCTRKTWWALCEQREGDSVNDVMHDTEASANVNVEDV